MPRKPWPDGANTPPSLATITYGAVGGGGGLVSKSAVTVVPAVSVVTQGPVPVQPPPVQPVKVEPVAGVAVRVTAVPSGNVAEQVVPQSIPPGELLTVPAPVPVLVTVRVRLVTGAMTTDSFAAPHAEVTGLFLASPE